MSKFNTSDVGHSHTGHRQKMWQDFADNPQSLTDTDIIEMALMLVIPRCDVRPVARRLLHAFKTLSAVVHAPVQHLIQIKGLGEKSARIFPLMAQVFHQATCPQQVPQILLETPMEIRTYCPTLPQPENACFHLLILNTHNQLVSDNILPTTAQEPITPLILTQRAVQQGAAAVILVHYFPHDVPVLQPEIESAHTMDSILKDLSVRLSEYVIYTPTKIYLLKENKLF